MKKETTYDRAEAVWKSVGILPLMAAIIWGVFTILIGLRIIPITLTTATGTILSPTFEGLAAFLGVLIVYTALYLAACAMRIAMFQMEQAEEHHRSSQEALANAMRDLAKEMRRRPDISSPVTFSLFGRPNDAPQVVPVGLSKSARD
jgi:hypothetical protein